MEWFETGVGYDITLWFNSLGEGSLNSLLKLFDFSGSEGFYILAFPLIFWSINKSLGKRLIIITLLSSFISLLLKDIWSRPRPYDVFVPGKTPIVNRLNSLESYGFPSGHVMGATAFWGYLSRISIKKSAIITCYIVVLLTALSRMVHGVLYIQDVVIGLFLGVVVLILFLIFEPRVTQLCNQKYTLLQRILLVCFSTGAALVLAILLNIEHLSDVITIVAGFLGAMIGIVLEKEFIDFSVDGGLSLRVGRYIMGLAVILIVYSGLKILFDLIVINNNYFRFIRYTLLGFVVTYPIPKLFVMLKLAESRVK